MGGLLAPPCAAKVADAHCRCLLAMDALVGSHGDHGESWADFRSVAAMSYAKVEFLKHHMLSAAGYVDFCHT